jgi:succinyl-diaminopimelate desuccinylase
VSDERLNNLSGTERALVEFTQRVVSTPSPSEHEHDVSALFAAELEKLGYRDVEVDEHGNVVGWLGEGPPRLMFNGHIDHVPPAGMDDPYGAQIVDAAQFGGQGLAIRGRGTCDMKANVAAGAYAAAFLDPEELRGGSFLFTADVQEETDSPLGVSALIERGVRAEYGISSESTGLALYLGHRGKVQFDMVVSGRSSHASTPSDGLNAVYRAVPFLQAIEQLPERLPSDPLYGQATITVTGISAEPQTAVAVVPSSCTIRIDRRYIPGETPDGVERELAALVAEVAERENIPAELERVNVYPLMAIDRDHELVAHGIAAVREVTGADPRIGAWRFGVNATFMSEAGIPSIGIGPGNEDFAHMRDEHVPIGELIESSRIYAALITRLCAKEGQ